MSIVDNRLGSKDKVEVGCVVKTDPQISMVTETNKAYTLGEMLGINQNLVLNRSKWKQYGFNPYGMVAEGWLGTVARQAVSVGPSGQ